MESARAEKGRAISEDSVRMWNPEGWRGAVVRILGELKRTATLARRECYCAVEGRMVCLVAGKVRD